MEEQQPYCEDRQQEAYEDYRNLVTHRDDLLWQCAELKRAYDAILDDCRIQEERIKVLEDKYNELILSVGNKYPNESRHETALRYIRNAETPKDNVAHCERAALEVKP
jgi:hypothetical protein